MFDVFYLGQKPNLFSHEKHAQSISEAKKQSKTRYFWIINSFSDYSDFDFLWEPAPWESHYVHAWPSQWQKDGQTYLVPKQEHDGIKYQSRVVPRIYREHNWEIPKEIDVENFDFTWHPDANDPPYIYQFGTQHQKTGGPRYVMEGATEAKYVRNIVANKTSSTSSVIYFIDHHDGNLEHAIETVNDKTIEIQTTRYASDYLSILRRIAKKADGHHEHVWVCSSLCDYSEFDFSWYPEQWQNHMVHVFPSNEQKFGDTFFIHVPSLLEQLDVELLEWHDINFIDNVSVPRWKCPVIEHNCDSHVDKIKSSKLSSPLVIFSCQNSSFDKIPTVSLWDKKKKTIIPLCSGGSNVIVPREAVSAIETQMYDYPYMDKTYSKTISENPLDVIFISNGETNAEENWEHLLHVMSNKPNRVRRVDGINGRVEAYQAALKESNTDWAFCVFAKLKVNPKFDWSWQPDRMQQRKHYIFHAKNPVNGLEYGSMAIIAYNKKLVFENKGVGLDFTLDQEHAVVPILSGVAEFNKDPWITWRTSFRECIKLRRNLPDIESEYRLEQWLTIKNGLNGDWSVAGAKDAIDYYNCVDGNFEKLKLSYEWKWLNEFFTKKYKLIT